MAIIVQTVPDRHTLVKGPRQYDFIPQDGATVVVVSTGPRFSIRTEVPSDEARQQWQRLKAQGYVEW